MAIGTIGAILGAVGNAASGVMSIINKRKQTQQLDAENARQQAYYDSKANEDALSKASTQQAMNQYDRKAEEQIANAQNVAAVTGATPEFTLAVQKGVAQGRADMMGNAQVNAEATQEKALDQSEQVRQEAARQRQALLAEQNQSFANLAANAGNVATSLMNAASAPKAKEDNKGKVATGSAPSPTLADGSLNKTLSNDEKEYFKNKFNL
jgi:hypothetical protein